MIIDFDKPDVYSQRNNPAEFLFNKNSKLKLLSYYFKKFVHINQSRRKRSRTTKSRKKISQTEYFVLNKSFTRHSKTGQCHFNSSLKEASPSLRWVPTVLMSVYFWSKGKEYIYIDDKRPSLVVSKLASQHEGPVFDSRDGLLSSI